MNKMNQANIKSWIEALRSGVYKQGMLKLKHMDCGGHVTHCCLGVVTELAVAANVIEDGKFDHLTGSYGYEFEHRKSDQYYESEQLPYKVSNWLGIKNSEIPSVYYKGEVVALTELNDDRGLTFIEIADLLEAQYLDEGYITPHNRCSMVL